MLRNSVNLSGSMEGLAATIPITDSGRIPLEMLINASPPPEVVHIDIKTIWWSARLYILAVVADLWTDVRKIIIKDGDDFVGMVSTSYVRNMLGLVHPEVGKFELELVSPLPALTSEALSEILRRWRSVLGETEGQVVKEQAVQMTVTRIALVRWLGDGMLTCAVKVVDPNQTTILDLPRVIDYPNDYVPIVGEAPPANSNRTPDHPPLRVINKAALNAQLAKNHIDDMLTGLGLRIALRARGTSREITASRLSQPFAVR